MVKRPKTPGDESDELNLSLLKRLLRAAEHLSIGDYERPCDESIQAYVAGNPTPRQRREVRSALTHSANFRSELLALAEERGTLHENETRAREDGTDKLVINPVKPRERPDIIVLDLDGAVPDNFAPLLEEALDNVLDDGYSRVVVDLGDVTYVSSLGWSAVLRAALHARRAGGGVKLAAMQSTVWSIFNLLEMERFVECHPSVEGALGRFEHHHGDTEGGLSPPVRKRDDKC